MVLISPFARLVHHARISYRLQLVIIACPAFRCHPRSPTETVKLAPSSTIDCHIHGFSVCKGSGVGGLCSPAVNAPTDTLVGFDLGSDIPSCLLQPCCRQLGPGTPKHGLGGCAGFPRNEASIIRALPWNCSFPVVPSNTMHDLFARSYHTHTEAQCVAVPPRKSLNYGSTVVSWPPQRQKHTV